MTLYYQTSSWSSQPQVSEKTKTLWKHVAEKKNWRITQLPNGYYQTEFKNQDDSWQDITRRETLDGAEAARFNNDLKENLGKNFAYKLAV